MDVGGRPAGLTLKAPRREQNGRAAGAMLGGGVRRSLKFPFPCDPPAAIFGRGPKGSMGGVSRRSRALGGPLWTFATD